jgi:hypothetical protein
MAGDSVLIAQGAASSAPGITTGPTAGWAGPVSWYSRGENSPLPTQAIKAGNYSGTVTMPAIAGDTVPVVEITGGTFSGDVIIENGTISAAGTGPTIAGGTFTGTVTRLFNNGISAITGGIYSPTATVTLNASGQVVPTDIPNDPGFAQGGGTFAPILNVSGNVYPAASNVKTGITYGPTGANYTGTFAGGTTKIITNLGNGFFGIERPGGHA